MKREQIVEEFFKKGQLLTEDAVKFLEQRGTRGYIEREYQATVLRETDFITGLIVMKNLTKRPTEVTTEDFLKFYTSKYEKLRKIIMERLPKDYISLNKIDASRNEVHVIGIVREIRERDGKKLIELEDPTTTVTVVIDEKEVRNVNDIHPDDVISLKAKAAGKVIYGKQIFFPDTPLRKPTTGLGKACFISDASESLFKWLERNDAKTVFVLGKIENKNQFETFVDKYCTNKTVIVIAVKDSFPSLAEDFNSKNIISLSNPAMVELGGLNVLMSSSMSVQKVKKRHMGKSDTVLPEDYLAIENIPDIVQHSSEEPTIKNYKAITFVSAGTANTPVMVDLSTREATFIEKFRS